MFPKIHVYVTPQEFTFVGPKGEELTLKTVVQISKKDGPWKVSEVGEYIFDGSPLETQAVNLFSFTPLLPEEVNKFDLLVAFMTYGITMSAKQALLPMRWSTVIFHQSDQLAVFLQGYEKKILSQAAEQVSACKILFE